MIKLEKYVKIIFTKSFKGGEYMDNEIDISEYLVWYVPFGPDSYHHFEEAFYGEKYKLGGADHQDITMKFIVDHQLEHKGRGRGHFDFVQTLCENGVMVGLSSGQKMNGKYFMTLALPENMSSYQLAFLESQMSILQEEFSSEPNLFSIIVHNPGPVSYNSGVPNFRNLAIEAIINNSPSKNDAIELLKQEIENQKRKEIKQR